MKPVVRTLKNSFYKQSKVLSIEAFGITKSTDYEPRYYIT